MREPGVLGPSLPVDIGARSQRQRILNAMAKSCAEKTFAATTIADIVAAAGISRATFYKHFADKRECFEATVDAFVDRLQAAASDAQAEGDTGPDAVEKAAEAILTQLAASPEEARLLLLEAPIVEPAIVGRCRELAIGGVEASLGSNGPAKRKPANGSPAGNGSAAADPTIAFGRAGVLIADYVAGNRTADLPELVPEMVYIALLPFVGHERALDQAKRKR
jgi:AcrR family transcriptional regulator